VEVSEALARCVDVLQKETPIQGTSKKD